MRFFVGVSVCAVVATTAIDAPSVAQRPVSHGSVAHNAKRAPEVTPTRVGKAPWVIVTGTSVSVPATFHAGSRGGAVKVGLVFTPGENGLHGKVLATPKRRTVRANHSVQTNVTGSVAGVSGVGRLAVCVDPKPTVSNDRCKFAGGLVGVAPTGDAFARIDAATGAGHVTADKAALYKLYAQTNDKRLPKILRGKVRDDAHDALTRLASGASTQIKSAALPYFAPPSASNNGWTFPKSAKHASAGRRADTQSDATPDCTGFDTLSDPPANELYKPTWKHVATSDGHALVWYVKLRAVHADRPHQVQTAAEWTAEDLGYAQAYADAFPTAWSKLTGVFGEPQSDAGEACYHGPDGRLDIYVSAHMAGGAFTFLPASAAIPYPAVGNYPKSGQWCTDRPSFIVMADRRDPFVLAHELMHVIQFSHRYATCAEPIAFWDEGGADWAGDYVYPDSQYELHNHGFLLKSPAAFSSPTNRSYDYWPFWMMLHRTAGIDVLKSVFTQLKTKQAIAAVGAAIPGGWAKQVPRLALTVWNQEPIGASGWSIDEGFKNWDNWTGVPEMAKPTDAKLNGATQQTLPLPKTSSTLQDSFEALAIGGIQEVDINDPKIREIQFQNGLASKPAHVDAMVQYDDGSWELKNWSGQATVTMCLDDMDQDIKKFVVLSTNVSTHDLPLFSHKVRLRDSCGPIYLKAEGGSSTGNWSLAGPALSCGGNATGAENESFTAGPSDFSSFLGTLTPTSAALVSAGDHVTGSDTISGCDDQDTPCVDTTVHDGRAGGVVVRLDIVNAGQDVKLTWDSQPINFGNFGSDNCNAGVFSGRGDDLVSTVALSQIASPGVHQFSISGDDNVADSRYSVTGTTTMTIKIQRVNEDGTPYQG